MIGAPALVGLAGGIDRTLKALNVRNSAGTKQDWNKIGQRIKLIS